MLIRVCLTMLSSILLFAGSSFASETERMDKLEERVDALDGKLDAILSAIQQQNQPQPTAKPPAKTEAPEAGQESATTSEKETVLAPGPLLDFYVLAEDDPLGQVPEDYSLGTVIDDKKLFLGERFKDTPDFASHWNARIGCLWSGLLPIEEAGKYTLALEVVLNPKAKGMSYDYYYSFATFLEIEGTKVLEDEESKGDWRDVNGKLVKRSKTEGIELQKGVYRVKVWLASRGFGAHQSERVLRLEDIILTLKLRGPNDRMAQEITPARLLHKE